MDRVFFSFLSLQYFCTQVGTRKRLFKASRRSSHLAGSSAVSVPEKPEFVGALPVKQVIKFKHVSHIMVLKIKINPQFYFDINASFTCQECKFEILLLRIFKRYDCSLMRKVKQLCKSCFLKLLINKKKYFLRIYTVVGIYIFSFLFVLKWIYFSLQIINVKNQVAQLYFRKNNYINEWINLPIYEKEISIGRLQY